MKSDKMAAAVSNGNNRGFWAEVRKCSNKKKIISIQI